MPTQAERMERLLAQQEKAIQRAFGLFVHDVKSERIFQQVADLLEKNDVEAAMRIVDSYVERLAGALDRAFTESADEITQQLARELGERAGGVALSFDPTHPEAATRMRLNRLQFIREFSREQRTATRNALSEALLEGKGPREAARAFRASIGLTERQQAAVSNYTRLLRTGSREALERDLRDRRFDPSVERAIDTGTPLTDAQIGRMTDRYTQRYLIYRSEMIARTETTRMLSQAREESLKQVMEIIDLPSDRVVRVWNSTIDERTRQWHLSMNGQERKVDEPFVDGLGNKLMYPGDPSAPPETTIHCRCIVTTTFKPPA